MAPPTCLALRSTDPILDLFVVHQLGVLVVEPRVMV